MSFLFKPRRMSIASLLMIISLLSFLVFYIPNYIIFTMADEPLWLTYFRLFFGEAVDFLVITLSVSFIVFRSSEKFSWRIFPLDALVLAATRCIYNLPYRYLDATANGNDWIESSRLSIGINLATVAFDTLVFMLFSYLALKLISLFSAHGKGEDTGILSLGTPEYKALFSVSLLVFIYNVIFEVIDIAVHLVEYGSFRTSELIYVVSKLSLFVILLLVSYILQTLLYNYYRKESENANQN